MNARYAHLHHNPSVFRSMTGLEVAEFDELIVAILPQYQTNQLKRLQDARLSRPSNSRQRAIGGGHPYSLDARDQCLLTLVWLRHYLTHETMGFLFDVSDSTATRVIGRIMPLLTAAGRAVMSLHDPHPHTKPARRRHLDTLLAELPEIVVIVDTFEQDVQRPKERKQADEWYSGKKKSHTIKSQVGVHGRSGLIADIGNSKPGPTNDLAMLKASELVGRLPEGVGAEGDLAYVGIKDLHPQGLGGCPRRKPRGNPRPQEDIEYNTAFARRRIIVEHSIGRLRRYQALMQRDRQHREGHV